VVVVVRETEYQLLLARHATHSQAAFFLRNRGQRIEDVQAKHAAFESALHRVHGAVPSRWRQARVWRRDLDRFLFEPDDIVVMVGQDGLVANAAKYLDGQPVIGINADAERYDGILVPHAPELVGDLLAMVATGRASFEARRMAEATLDDGQTLLALNEVFIGVQTHQSARYRIRHAEEEERHSSSGVIVATGTGATGWARSIHAVRESELPLPNPTSSALAFFVREPFPSIATGTSISEGLIPSGNSLEIVSEMNEGGVIFADGIESDFLAFDWGQEVSVAAAESTLNLVRG
jgi:NAD kinase